ncbi:interleukin-1 receptor-associated kinase 3 isoform X1 [Pontoporia blainvillei]|uniref:Interleukin-1 receptor-associated kinase 3 isoform X1 n=1 Tax=Pontoporia blainvillei TaxID=48723 RepID=A0ABX0S1U9_PONBL|nr:interleukin-1 receptor-associated kinase 3 isoform X1 [Pontoporia blainvillei]
MYSPCSEVQDSYHYSTEKVEDQVQGSRNSANILLDDQFQAKLTDFAMAHIRPHLEPQSSVISTASSSSKHLWYMPEEYIRQGKLSVKTDVYSFGIVLTVLESTQASLYFAEDPPTSLKSFRSPSPLFFDNVPSIPVEDDENQNNPSLPHDKGSRKGRTTQKTPFECSQSEVTFLGFDRKTGRGRNEDTCHSACEESWSPQHAAPSQDLRASGVNMDPSAEVPGHSYRSMPVEASCSSELSWNECEQYKKASVSPEDKEESKYC